MLKPAGYGDELKGEVTFSDVLGLSFGCAALAGLTLKRFHSMRQRQQYHLKAFAYCFGTSRKVDN